MMILSIYALAGGYFYKKHAVETKEDVVRMLLLRLGEQGLELEWPIR